jgi:hypothetical protein
MKNVRNIVAAGALTLAMGVTSMTVFAAAKYDSPQDALAGITGKSVEEIAEMKVENKTYGAIAAEAGKLDEFKAELFEQKKEAVQERVTEGKIAQEDADALLERVQEHQAVCDGEGNPGEGLMEGAGLQLGNGPKDGNGNGEGLQSGEGNGIKERAGDGNGNGKGFGGNK